MPTTLIITNDFPPKIGGIESFVAELCRLLDDDVVVLTSMSAGAAAYDATLGFEVVRMGRVLLPTPRVGARAVELMRRTGADRVVFGAAAPLGLLARRLRAAGARRLLGLTHGHEIWWARLPVTRWLLRRISDDVDQLSAISDFTAGSIGRALSPEAGQRMIRLSPPVDLMRFAPGTDGCADRARCIAVGRFVPQKGFDHLLQAWRLVLDDWPLTRPDPELMLVGDGPQRARLAKLAARLGLGRSLIMTGALPRNEVVCQLQAARVFALPMRTRLAGLNPEGLGLAALEAAACGLPVLVGNSGGAPETVRDFVSGFVVDPRRHRAVADRLVELLADPERARLMGALGREHVAARFGTERARLTVRAALQLG